MQIGAPQNATIHIPRNRTDADGAPIPQVTRDIDQSTLRAALNHVSNYIHRHNRRLKVIAVGGAVNTIYLQSRTTTHDADIFSSDVGNQSRVLLDEGIHEAQQHIPALGTDWLNTETRMWISPPMHVELTRLAEQQIVHVYDGQGLVILAAQLKYAFTAKVNRILTGGD